MVGKKVVGFKADFDFPAENKLEILRKTGNQSNGAIAEGMGAVSLRHSLDQSKLLSRRKSDR